MKTDLDTGVKRAADNEKEMPASVRKTLDHTYDQIRLKAKKKRTRSIWTQATAAACTLLLTGALLTNGQVRAHINDLFSFGDKGIDRAITEGFAQNTSRSAIDQNIKVTLGQHFADANKAGLSFLIEFEEPDVLDSKVTEVTMDFRLKNGDGVYVEEFIPDTKPLKGDNRYNVSGVNLKSQLLDAAKGTAQLDVVIDSDTGTLPILQDAIVEIESINIFRGSEFSDLTKIEGNWNIEVINEDNGQSIPKIEYGMNNSSSIIQVNSATANPTSLNLQFTVDKVFKDETPFVFSMKIADENGAVYEAEGFTIDTQDNRTTISTNFPITSYDDFDNLTFMIDDIGEVDLIKK